MSLSSSPKFTIYKASAGSGKTYTLTQRFLSLLLREKENYKHILAATFTNKATEEMKSRVIKELYLIASGASNTHKKFLREEIPSIKSDTELQQIAQTTLANILHNYSYFNITTIDSFFQRIIRSFARELHVSSNYNIEIEDSEVLKKISTQLFFDLEKSKNEGLLNWITSFTEEQIENGHSWNVNSEILKLSEEFLKEGYKQASSKNGETLGNFNSLISFLKEITKELNAIEKELKKLADEAIEIIKKYGLESADFKYGKNSGINFLYKITKGEIPEEIGARTLKMIESTDEFYTNKSPKEQDIISACENGLQDALSTCYEYWNKNIETYNSISVIRSNFYSLGILSDLEQLLIEYTNENNILLLSNSNELISKIIDQKDTPFIYEKTGHQFRYYMLDEFQDTSQLQWDNLKPLIYNSLSEGNENLIVGDVKQSIYRWRNSDWKLLDHHIKKEFSELNEEKILPTNWRSSKNIIRFNNTFIGETKKWLKNSFQNETELDDESNIPKLFDSAYSDITQQVPPTAKDGGHVSFKIYNNEESDTWKDNTKTQLISIIEKAQDNGYKLSDIAILVRTKTEGADISQYLLKYASAHSESKYRYNVISNEALWISGSYNVKFIISFFRYLVNPSNIYTSEINLIYQNYLNNSVKAEIIHHDSKLTEETLEKIKQISSFSLIETTEEIIKEFNLGQEPNEAIFVQSFIDLIHSFEQMQSGSINEFLTWWDETGSEKSISTPEGQDAINMLTIHKSKGLEFKIVIVPFLDWNFTRSKGYLWVNTKDAPLNKIPYLPVAFSSKLKNTQFKDEYTNEILLQYIDNLNLLYVAFTRSKEALYVFAFNNYKEKKIKDNFGNILPRLFKSETENSDLTINLSQFWNIEKSEFSMGQLPYNNKEKEEYNNNLFLKHYNNQKEIKQPELRYQSADFEITDNRIKNNSRQIGKIWHRIFEQITSLDEIPTTIANLESQGVISKNATKEIQQNITNLIQEEPIKHWFSPLAKVRTEAAIITPGGQSYRPDRIIEINKEVHVVDFKFGHLEKSCYNKQVLNYVELMRSMGYKNVKGYLWYVNLQKVVLV